MATEYQISNKSAAFSVAVAKGYVNLEFCYYY